MCSGSGSSKTMFECGGVRSFVLEHHMVSPHGDDDDDYDDDDGGFSVVPGKC